MEIILLVITLAMLVFASYCDLKASVIPGWITLPVIAVGLVLQLFRLSAADYLIRIAAIVGLSLIYPLVMGGGDAKVLMSIMIMHGVGCSALTLLFAELLVLGVHCLRDPAKTKQAVSKGLDAIAAMDLSGIKKDPDQKVVLFVPYLAAGFLITAFLLNIH